MCMMMMMMMMMIIIIIIIITIFYFIYRVCRVMGAASRPYIDCSVSPSDDGYLLCLH
jgi:uncharacterized membrane protein (DUF106 family)